MVRRAILAVVAAAAACSFPEQPIPQGVNDVVVHAALDPSRFYQTVALSTTHGPFEPQDSAEVQLTMPDGTVQTGRQVKPSQGDYSPAAEYRFEPGSQFAPGGTFQLRVVTAHGDTITGQTTVPSAAPASLVMLGPFNRASDTLRFSWPRVPGARAYEVQVWMKQSYGSYYSTQLTYKAFGDTSISLAGIAKRFDDTDVFSASGTAYVFVYAVDDNYYEYYRVPGDPYMGAVPSHLKGGLGFFGAMVPVARYTFDVR
jgi:hypothetical protein